MSPFASYAITEINVDMNDAAMKKYAFDTAILAILRNSAEGNTLGRRYFQIAKEISEAFDAKYGRYWACLVWSGEAVGSNIWKRNTMYVEFAVGAIHIKLYRTPSGDF